MLLDCFLNLQVSLPALAFYCQNLDIHPNWQTVNWRPNFDQNCLEYVTARMQPPLHASKTSVPLREIEQARLPVGPTETCQPQSEHTPLL